MSLVLRSPRNLWAGFLYIFIGGGAAILAHGLSFGTAMRMGPGFMPTVLGASLATIGLISVVRAFSVEGEPLGEMAWRPIVFVTGSLVVFAALLTGAGLLIALAALLAIAPAASRFVRYSPMGVLLALLLIAFCAGVFVEGLGLPLRLIGSWFRG